jgi:hypothetical protein
VFSKFSTYRFNFVRLDWAFGFAFVLTDERFDALEAFALGFTKMLKGRYAETI